MIYQIITDDFDSFFSRETNLTKEVFDRTTKHHLDELSKYDAVFDFAKYCLALPYYIFENEQKLVDVIYKTSLADLLSGPLTKRKYKSIPSRFKVFAKPLFYLESTNQKAIEKKELSESRFHVKRSGYWKRIGFDEEGFDKKGRNIVGKTWVETNESYYTSPKGITTVYEKEYFETENAGYLYVMRQPTLEENIFKVGLTKRTPERRSKELYKTGSPDNFFIINSYYTKDCTLAESQVHEKLKEYRLSTRREFFRCDLKYILDTCENVIDEINKE